MLQPKTTKIDKREKHGTWANNSYQTSTLQGESAPGHGKDQLRTRTTQHKHSQHKSRSIRPYLHVGSVALALLPVDVQAELLAHLADLRAALSEVDPRRLALLPLIHISCQVIQQLWEETEILLHRTSAARAGSLSKDHVEKHFKYAGFGFLLAAIKTWEKNKWCLLQ